MADELEQRLDRVREGKRYERYCHLLVFWKIQWLSWLEDTIFVYGVNRLGHVQPSFQAMARL